MGQPVRIFPFLAPLLWNNRSAFLGELSLLLETTSLISRGAVAQLLGTTDSLPWNSYSDIEEGTSRFCRRAVRCHRINDLIAQEEGADTLG